ncbi:MAG: phosphate transport system regulatory protein PhoU [Chloroflexi bacterium]|nr:MAG: phosphate transport system regulatory protein PhoU [Chloroflexota bacterium]RLC89687.1 MAG: phosphate transport system regulatory protein PhoU [Chloroflexota bacterium]HEY66734.1 phosphate signaling complex protein PhoU [Thermoflexia bacterium]
MSKARALFDRELTDLRDNILHLGNMVEAAIEGAVQALREQDKELAHQVITGDAEINTKRYDIEEQCLRLIATQQPAAGDLRAIVAAIHIVTELERMGDYASGIAELATRLADQPHLKPLIDVPRMAEIDGEMIRASLDAYFKHDPDLALETAKRDAEIDGLYDQVYRELLTYMLSDPQTITRATYLLWVAHKLERIADRVTNICERVIFISTGEFQELNF